MTSPSVAQGPAPCKTFVPPLPDYYQGKVMYYQGRPLSACRTDEAANGWLDAEIDFVYTEIKREAREARKAGL